MLGIERDLLGCAIEATDGPIGRVKDCFFDDRNWVVRYLVVDTGTWLASRKVLVAPRTIDLARRSQGILPASLTRAQVRDSPDIDTEKPVSRQHELRFAGYYGYPFYWDSPAQRAIGDAPDALPSGDGIPSARMERKIDPALAHERVEAERSIDDDPHLRSVAQIVQYDMCSGAESIGRVADILVDARSWDIRFLLLDAGSWWNGHQALVAPQLIRGIDWRLKRVDLELTRDLVREAPRLDPRAALLTRARVALHDFDDTRTRPGGEPWPTDAARAD
jgi:uncharacterized protein YrrD